MHDATPTIEPTEPMTSAAFARPRGHEGAERFRLVPQGVRADPSWSLGAAEWAALGIPGSLACFVHDSRRGRWAAWVPGPAGPVEAALDLGAWARVAARSRLVASVESDVEALLVRGDRGGRCEAFAVPIDRGRALLELAGRTVDGPADGARRAIDAFLAELAAECAAGSGRSS